MKKCTIYLHNTRYQLVSDVDQAKRVQMTCENFKTDFQLS